MAKQHDRRDVGGTMRAFRIVLAEVRRKQLGSHRPGHGVLDPCPACRREKLLWEVQAGTGLIVGKCTGGACVHFRGGGRPPASK